MYVISPTQPASTAACSTQRRTAVSLRSISRQLAGTVRSPCRTKATTSAFEGRREGPSRSSTRLRLLHLLPHPNTLLVSSRPHLRCPPVRGKSTCTAEGLARDNVIGSYVHLYFG